MSFLMALLFCCGTLSAQNGKRDAKGKDVKTKTTTVSEAARPFTGTIIYDVPDVKSGKKAPSVVRENRPVEGSLDAAVLDMDNGKRGTLNAGGKTKEKKLKPSLSFDGMHVFGMLNGIGICLNGKELEQYCIEDNDGGILVCEMPIVKMMDFVPDASTYIRTDEKRFIAGIEATRYQCNLPAMEGEIWVAEGLELSCDALPYIGLRHPVLEGDFVVAMNGDLYFRTHMVATKVQDNISGDVLKLLKEEFNTISIDDFVERIKKEFSGR